MVNVLVVGAGASIEEGCRAGLPVEQQLPTIRDFPTLWARQFSPDPRVLYAYLIQVGVGPTADPLMTFKVLAASGDPRVNVERFFEFAWLNRVEQSWEVVLHSAVFVPIVLRMAHLSQFTAAQATTRRLRPRDVVVNLNYDTVFEIGLKRAGVAFEYLPEPRRLDVVLIAKPHGSINLVLTETDGRWLDPEQSQTLTYPDEHMPEFRGIVPPRFNKSYAQHPIAAAACASISSISTASLTFWGASLAESDSDLLDLYRGWSRPLAYVELIHPNPHPAAKANIERLLGKPVRQFVTPEDWAGQT